MIPHCLCRAMTIPHILSVFVLLHTIGTLPNVGLVNCKLLDALYQSIAARVELQTIISCTSDNLATTIEWVFRKYPHNTKQVLVESDKVMPALTSKFYVHFDRRISIIRSDLIIRDVQLSDAGTYRCYELDDTQNRMDTELTVISLYKFCTVDNMHFDANISVAAVSCAALFRGKMTPTIDCEPSNGDILRSHRNNSVIIYKHIFYNIVNETDIVCLLHFNSSSMSNFNWTSQLNGSMQDIIKHEITDSTSQDGRCWPTVVSLIVVSSIVLVNFSIIAMCYLHRRCRMRPTDSGRAAQNGSVSNPSTITSATQVTVENQALVEPYEMDDVQPYDQSAQRPRMFHLDYEEVTIPESSTATQHPSNPANNSGSRTLPMLPTGLDVLPTTLAVVPSDDINSDTTYNFLPPVYAVVKRHPHH